MRHLFLGILLLHASLLSAAWERHNGQGFAAKATASAATLLLTETLNVAVTLKSPTGYTVDPQNLTSNLLNYGESPLDSFKLISQDSQTTTLDGITTTTLTFKLDPLIAGPAYLTFRDITFKPTSASLVPITLTSGTLKVNVTTTDEGDALQVADVLPLENKPILAIDPENEEELAQQDAEQPSHNRQIFLERAFPWHYLVLFPLAIVLIVGAARLVLRLARELRTVQKPPTPQATASKKLRTLAKSDLIAKTDFAEFYVQLTQILRDFIAAQYELAAPEMTTEEFMQAMITTDPFDPQTRQALVDLLEYADKVKFAKEHATPENCKTALAYAQKFVSRQRDIRD